MENVELAPKAWFFSQPKALEPTQVVMPLKKVCAAWVSSDYPVA